MGLTCICSKGTPLLIISKWQHFQDNGYFGENCELGNSNRTSTCQSVVSCADQDAHFRSRNYLICIFSHLNNEKFQIKPNFYNISRCHKFHLSSIRVYNGSIRYVGDTTLCMFDDYTWGAYYVAYTGTFGFTLYITFCSSLLLLYIRVKNQQFTNYLFKSFWYFF